MGSQGQWDRIWASITATSLISRYWPLKKTEAFLPSGPPMLPLCSVES